ncbi:phage tail protein [Rubritalea spongiae]|uniref:Phage tail protein n=2 Tax=Rubritalea spongiae TaxID=430797 RepID=A0ABW5DYX9_9BACT
MYPAVNFHFDVKFNGGGIMAEGGFQQVSGLKAKLGSQKVKSGGGANPYFKLPTPSTFDNIKLSRGVMVGSSLRHWVTQAIYNFEFTPITVTIILLDENQNPVITWTAYNVWPVSWSVDDLNSENGKVAIETFELAFDRITTKFKT